MPPRERGHLFSSMDVRSYWIPGVLLMGTMGD